MLVDFTRVTNIFIVCGRTDMRKGIDGLASIVQYEYNMDLYDNAIFLFCGGKSDRFKALYWDGGCTPNSLICYNFFKLNSIQASFLK